MTFAPPRTNSLLLRPVRDADAEPMYLARGIVPTREIDDGEVVARRRSAGPWLRLRVAGA